MASSSPTTNANGERNMPSVAKNKEDIWANIPPLHTIKDGEMMKYQIVDWDYNHPHHPRYLAGCVLIKSLFHRDKYYWIPCTGPLPKKEDKNFVPKIHITAPAPSASSSTSQAGTAPLNINSEAFPVWGRTSQQPQSQATQKSSSSHTVSLASLSTYKTGNLGSESITTSSPNAENSAKKRAIPSKQQEGRNVRTEFGRAAVEPDEKPHGIEPAYGG